jgi:hypothetical protein
MGKGRLILLASLATLAAAAVPAGAGTREDDYNAVYRDWQPDRRITPCRFTERQLENAREVANSNPDFAYSGFPSDIETEIARWRSGRCEKLRREASPLYGLRITGVRGRGGASRESVMIRNTADRTLRLDRSTLRNRRGVKVALPRGIKVRAGRSVTVSLGCAGGRPRVRGGRVLACSGKALFADAGDVAKLADRRGVVVSQRGFGRYRRARTF